MTRDNKYGMIAFMYIVGVGVVPFFSEWNDVNTRKWLGVTLWTGLIFGSVVYLHAKRLKIARCPVVFLALLALHLTVLMSYLRSARFPGIFFLFFSPFEAAAVTGVVVLVAGERSRRGHRIKQSKDA